MTVEPLRREHWDAVQRIYLEGIATGNATFQTTAPEWEQWDHGHLPACRLVALEGDRVVGWAALSPVSSRCVYGGVAEVSIYVEEKARGAGVGKRLLTALIDASEAAGLWTLQAGIFPENTASVELHRKCGFRLVGVREKMGKMNGRWRDVCLMERRSAVVN